MAILLPAAEAYGRTIMSSVGAVPAAELGRGIRSADAAPQDYELLLPTLPSGPSILNTVFLHADVKARPYRLEHFRDALALAALLPEVLALGAYQYNHVWAVTFKSDEGKKRLLAADDFKVKDRRCVLVDPCNQDVRLKLHWLLHHVQDDEVRAALAPYGKVTGITRDKWRVSGCTDMASTTRSVSIKLKPGVAADDLPHQLRIAGDLALVVVPGRAPLCLRCKGKGHIRRECRVPRCTLCRRFGHDESQCVRTYASVTGPMGIDDNSEHLMDVADAEEAASGASDGADVTPASEAEEKQGKADAALGADATRQAGQPDTPPAERAASSGVEANVVEEPAVDATMLDGEASASCPNIKRSRVDDVTDPCAASHEEPPPKATPLRRPRLNIKPKVPVDDPRVAKPPP
uniref:Putative l1-5 dr n=1 Tax=Ixodes ricinus TaxID=34613 RepID=A0A6B0VC32_IXORI